MMQNMARGLSRVGCVVPNVKNGVSPAVFPRSYSLWTRNVVRNLPLRGAYNAKPRQTLSKLPSRHYSAQSDRDKPPKFRYFVLIALIGTAAFLVGIQKTNDKGHNELSEEQYAKIKAGTSKGAAAFTPDEAFVVFVLGGPGAGKGTQCDNIVRDYNFAHLSAGDLLRAEQKREGSKYGQLIADYLKDGKIVPQEVTIALLKQAMEEQIQKGTNHFLVDGFPRKMDQALTFEDTVVPSKFTLFFECPEAVMLSRLLKRGETSGRTDDNIESIRKRFHVFLDQSMPVVNYFAIDSKVATLRCDNPPDEVYAKVREVLAAHGVQPRTK